jgi:chemotaxis methyl-accepting protein methylase
MAQDEGQTAYSVALYRKETGQGWPLMAQLRDSAAAGLFERAALSALAPAVAARWFSERDGSALAAADRADPAGGASPAIDLWGEAPATASASAAQPDPVMLSPVIRAGVGTLALDALPQATMALIICDHVLVHEGEAARARLAERLYDALRPGGLLCLGTGETLSRASGLFNVITCAGGVAYQKPYDGP